MLTGQPDSCLKYFEIGLVKFPDKAVTLKKYAAFFAAMGMNSLAGSYMARIIPLNPGSMELRREAAPSVQQGWHAGFRPVLHELRCKLVS